MAEEFSLEIVSVIAIGKRQAYLKNDLGFQSLAL